MNRFVFFIAFSTMVLLLVLTGCRTKDDGIVHQPAVIPANASNVFLWKPVSERGTLVVLVPYSLSRDPVGKLTVNGIEGTYSGNTHNGMRAHYRYPKTGSEYGRNIVVVLQRGKDKWSWTVPNGGQRYEEGFKP